MSAAKIEPGSGRDDARAPAGVKLRSMEPRDVPEVLAIERDAFSNPWKERTFRDLLPRGDATLVVAEREDRVVGYVVLWFGSHEGELADIAVAEEHRGEGIGSLLLDRAVEDTHRRGIRNLFLEVRASNVHAATIYERRGFRVVRVRKDYYEYPKEDALVMLKSLW